MEQARAMKRSSTHSTAEWESGAEQLTFTTEMEMEMEKKKLDPHVLLILEHGGGEVYTEQKGTLKSLVKGSQDDGDMWKVLTAIKKDLIQTRLRLTERNAKVLSRSLSVGSPRRASVGDVMRLDRFKIRTLDVKKGGGGGGPQLNN